MEKYSDNELKNVSEETGQMVTALNEAVNWIDTSLHLIDRTADTDKKYHVSYDLKSERRKLKKVSKVITSKPTVALFGASQVGKSYLAKSLLADEQNNLLLTDTKGNRYDFIAEINPEGQGTESTSVVTRFSYFNQPEGKPPIAIRMFTVKDLITVISDGYLADIKKKNLYINREVLEQHIHEIKGLISTNKQNIISEDDVYDIHDYLRIYEDKNKNIFMAFSEVEFWRFLGSNIERIDEQYFPKVFSILWGKNEFLTQLFNELFLVLKKLNYNSLIYTNFETVLKNNGRILDVNTLTNFFGTSVDLQVTDAQNNSYSVKNTHLCALTSEIVFNISKSVREEIVDFVRDVDILDFPGARSREEFPEDILEKQIEMLKLFLRGKVAYLFNSYSQNYEINTLIAANRSVQTDVKSVPEMINNWIHFNIGETPAERDQVLREFKTHPLFVIFTWWNMQLVLDQDQDIDKKTNEIKTSFDYKWKQRFVKLIKEEIFGSYNWWQEWTPNARFSNYYLLRDFKYTTDIFAGFDKERRELSIKPDREKYHTNLQESFINSAFVKSIFANPTEAWNESSVVGKDGTELIIRNLRQISTNKIKTKRYLSIIDKAIKDTLVILTKYFNDEATDDSIEKAKETSGKIQTFMDTVFTNNYLFGKFISTLHVTPNEIYNIYHKALKEHTLVTGQELNKYYLIKARCKALSAEKSYDENLEALRECYNFKDKEETIDHFENELNIVLDTLFTGTNRQIKKYSETLAQKAGKFWIDQKLSIENFTEFIEKSFKKEYLIQLLENLKVNYTKIVKMDEKIAHAISNWVDSINGPIFDAEDMIATISAEMINDFVNLYGWSFYDEPSRNQLKSKNEQQELGLVFPLNNEEFRRTDNESLDQLFDFIINYEDKMNSVKYTRESLKLYGGKIESENADTVLINNTPFLRNLYLWTELMKIGFIATRDIPDYDRFANQELGAIISKIQNMKISIS